MSRVARDAHDLLLGEWACLGILYNQSSHGFAISARLRPDGDIGRIWSLTRPLTYRALEQLQWHGYVDQVGQESGLAGGNRTLLKITRSGRAIFRSWINTPVAHLRDMRSELLLKLILSEESQIDISAMLMMQRREIDALLKKIRINLEATDDTDMVLRWRLEVAEATKRFIDSID